MASRASTVVAIGPRCPLCTIVLAEADDIARGLCGNCQGRPEARRLHLGGRAPVGGAARGFTPADKGLIRKLHGYMPLAQLLGILNERLHADLGPDAAPYTLGQLQLELPDAVDPGHTDGWTGVRKLLSQARRSGVLLQITAQVLEDFAVVYTLTPAQLMHLKDVVLHAKEDR